jgi:opacity protein-like surface antigen
MKKILGILLTSTVLTGTAFANAGPAPCPACPEQPVARWGGFKLGAQLGYGHAWKRFTLTETDNFTGAQNFAARSDLGAHGIFGGFHAGYDWQFNKNWIVGVDTSIDFNGIKGTSRLTDANGFLTTFSNKSKYTVAVVPRLGYVLNDSLFYVGAGWAGSKWNVNVFDQGNNITVGTNKFKSAFRLEVGAGQRMGRVLLTVAGTYDWFGSISRTVSDGFVTDRGTEKPRVLSAKLKLSYMI